LSINKESVLMIRSLTGEYLKTTSHSYPLTNLKKKLEHRTKMKFGRHVDHFGSGRSFCSSLVKSFREFFISLQTEFTRLESCVGFVICIREWIA
jgi:hypothetical protein